MDLLIQKAYPSLSGYGKFTISFAMKRSYREERVCETLKSRTEEKMQTPIYPEKEGKKVKAKRKRSERR